MSMHWTNLTRSFEDIRSHDSNSRERVPIRKGTLAFTPGINATDMTSLDFFDVYYHFTIESNGSYDGADPDPMNQTAKVAALDRQQTYPNIWIQADSLAKSAYSTVLTDLGQTGAAPNILTDSRALAYFTANFSADARYHDHALPGPARQPYAVLAHTTGPLGITPSVLRTSYLCQVPRMKSGGNLFLSVLVADLVFLQALWKVFTLLTDTFLLRRRRRPEAQHCQGCLTREESVALRDVRMVSLGSLGGDALDDGLGTADDRARRPARRRASSHQPLLSDARSADRGPDVDRSNG